MGSAAVEQFTDARDHGHEPAVAGLGDEYWDAFGVRVQRLCDEALRTWCSLHGRQPNPVETTDLTRRVQNTVLWLRGYGDPARMGASLLLGATGAAGEAALRWAREQVAMCGEGTTEALRDAVLAMAREAAGAE